MVGVRWDQVEAGVCLVTVRCDVSDREWELDYRLGYLPESRLCAPTPQFNGRRIALQIGFDRFREIHGEGLTPPNDSLGICYRTDQSPVTKHTVRLLEICRPIVDVVDNVYREHQLETLGGELQALCFSEPHGHARRPPLRRRQHFFRRVDTKALAAERSRGGPQVITRAAPDLQDFASRGQAGGLDQIPQDFRVNPSMAGVFGGKLLLINHRFFPLDRTPLSWR